jgi:hypothetical protein
MATLDRKGLDIFDLGFNSELMARMRELKAPTTAGIAGGCAGSAG